MAKHHRLYSECVDVTIEQIDSQELLIILQSAIDAVVDLEVIDVTPEPPVGYWS